MLPTDDFEEGGVKYAPLKNPIDAIDIDVVEHMRKQNQKINAENGTDLNHRWKKFINSMGKIVEHKIFVIVMTILTIYSLFSADIRVQFTHTAEADDIFEVLSSLTFFAFLFEITFTAVTKYGDYFQWPSNFKRVKGENISESLYRRLLIGSFYFWLDVLATLTLILEMPWIVGDMPSAADPTQQASSAARVAARAGRIVRLMRMVRHINFDRFLSLFTEIPRQIIGECWTGFIKTFEKKPPPKKGSKGYKSPKKTKSKRDLNDIDSYDSSNSNSKLVTSTDESDGLLSKEDEVKTETVVIDEAIPGMPAVDSLVGATMSELTNKRVIMCTVAMLIFIPMLSTNDTDNANVVMANLIHTAGYQAFKATEASRTQSLFDSVNDLIESQQKKYIDSTVADEKVKSDIVKVSFTQMKYPVNGANVIYKGWENTNYLNKFIRSSEEQFVEISSEYTNKLFKTNITFDTRDQEMTAARQSMYTTLFVISVLVFGTYFFTREVYRQVIAPIQTMVALVSQISQNPLGVDYDKELGEKDGFFEGMETTILLNTINKIGSLMRVGFGEAGASVIAENLKNSAGGRLNLMTGGRMITSIFGFCDVRQFTDTTECLQEEVMLFVNRIGHILHNIVVQCSGSANKNIGDAFLLTWKLEDDMPTEQMALLADQALLTFCRALIELSTYQDFICNFSAAANERLYKRFPGYLVRIGSGLHVGWAIEGAIGSNRKIDASYLSPHVNFTEFLESSTKAYGVPLLISEPFFKMLSPYSAKYIRNVDQIRKPGEDQLGLYTYDSDLALDWAQLRRATKNRTERRRSKGGALDENNRKGRNRKNRQKDALDENEGDVEEGSDGNNSKEIAPDIKVAKYKQSVWEKDGELVQLRHMVYTNPEFRPMWDTGIAAYIAGDWPTAEHIFNDTLTMSGGKCGPSKFLLNEIKENGGIAPNDWPGYRLEE
jgi:class 3 adenylate cyclase